MNRPGYILPKSQADPAAPSFSSAHLSRPLSWSAQGWSLRLQGLKASVLRSQSPCPLYFPNTGHTETQFKSPFSSWEAPCCHLGGKVPTHRLILSEHFWAVVEQLGRSRLLRASHESGISWFSRTSSFSEPSRCVQAPLKAFTATE